MAARDSGLLVADGSGGLADGAPASPHTWCMRMAVWLALRHSSGKQCFSAVQAFALEVLAGVFPHVRGDAGFSFQMRALVGEVRINAYQRVGD